MLGRVWRKTALVKFHSWTSARSESCIWTPWLYTWGKGPLGARVCRAGRQARVVPMHGYSSTWCCSQWMGICKQEHRWDVILIGDEQGDLPMSLVLIFCSQMVSASQEKRLEEMGSRVFTVHTLFFDSRDLVGIIPVQLFSATVHRKRQKRNPLVRRVITLLDLLYNCTSLKYKTFS